MKIKILLLIIVSIFMTGCWETENGEKVGNIVKFAKEGVLIGTWEAELIRGGLNSGNGSFGRSFHFTVEDKKLIPIVDKALNDQREVNIKYHREIYVSPFRCESSRYFLDDIIIK